MKAHTILDKQMIFLLWAAHFEDIGSRIDIIYVGDSKPN